MHEIQPLFSALSAIQIFSITEEKQLHNLPQSQCFQRETMQPTLLKTDHMKPDIGYGGQNLC